MIRGPWNNPQVTAQLSNINPEAATKTIQALTDGLFSSSPGKPGSLDSMMKGMRDMLEQGKAGTNSAPSSAPSTSTMPRDPTQPPPPPRTGPPQAANQDGMQQMQESMQGILKDLMKNR